ncbi:MULTISPECIES: Kdo hydroxylase family protein [unclassified Legionella]|uniref:Kdo hydroxylase family protein n=1 Tax=unclassified Legionella TaxID=2622702 RepID=UPI001056D76C|nr:MULTISPECIES: Kdo hydroxylase family protein [unclassified Legionella]MDI9818186.1 Kdo hydroxylase family protein [Legionella sp. PL877]
MIHTLDAEKLDSLNEVDQQKALVSLESGKVIYLPSYSFTLQPDEKDRLFSDNLLDSKHKNLSFDYRTGRLGGIQSEGQTTSANMLKALMQRYAEFAKHLAATVFPEYQDSLLWGRTSYRPAEIKGRSSSKRKDDTRLHVDSFPSTPVNGQRILRIFCNINPDDKPRVWHLGESFDKVMERFATSIPAYNRTVAKFLYWMRATKSLRSPYDHYQLNLHDKMKLDDEYQQSVDKQRVEFKPQSTWIVFTDQVSHAALSGQFLLEQTFYLPVEAMMDPALSPLKYWENNKAASFVGYLS